MYIPWRYPSRKTDQNNGARRQQDLMTDKPVKATPKDKRKAAEQRGRTAEMLAAMLLRIKGYRILAQRYRCRAGEIDIIARKSNIFAFIEVKARASMKDALESVTADQQKRIEAAAEFWLGDEGSREFDVRFDVIVVVPGRLPAHMMDAWRPGW